MKELVRKVALLEPADVGTVEISRDHYFPRAYAIDLQLDSIPDHVWQDIFDREWKSSRHLWDRKVFIIGNRLRLVTSLMDIEDKLDWVKEVVARTNSRIDEYQQEIEARTAQLDEQANRQREWEERANVETIRDTVRKHFGSR